MRCVSLTFTRQFPVSTGNPLRHFLALLLSDYDPLYPLVYSPFHWQSQDLLTSASPFSLSCQMQRFVWYWKKITTFIIIKIYSISDDLATQGARASSVMVVNLFSLNIPASTTEKVISLRDAVIAILMMKLWSHNAPVQYPTIHHIVTEMWTPVQISVTKWCIVGYLSDVLWDLWDGTIWASLINGHHWSRLRLVASLVQSHHLKQWSLLVIWTLATNFTEN